MDLYTYQPAPSCPPCLSLGVDHGRLLVVFLSDGKCSAPGSEPLTSGSAAAVTPSLTQQRFPCYSTHEFIKFMSTLKHNV